MRSQGRVVKLVTVVLAAGLLAAGCGSRTAAEQPRQEAVTSTDITSTVASSPTPTPYAGPLFIASSRSEDPGVTARGAAAGALECAGEPSLNYSGGNVPHRSAKKALETFTGRQWSGVPRAGYRIEREEAGRVLYSYDVDGRTKVAIIVSNAERPGYGGGWHVESQASCDAAEWPDDVTDALGFDVWTDKDGVRVPTSKVQSSKGPEHCDWQSVTFLYLGRQQYLRDPKGAISHARYKSSYDAAATLPGDAEDTGFRLDGKSLWLAADESAAYVGAGPTVERWPAPKDMVGCA